MQRCKRLEGRRTNEMDKCQSSREAMHAVVVMVVMS